MGLFRAERDAHFREPESPVSGGNFQSPRPRELQYTQSHQLCAAAFTQSDCAGPIARSGDNYEYIHIVQTSSILIEISLVMQPCRSLEKANRVTSGNPVHPTKCTGFVSSIQTQDQLR
jgi:hypothetical protein